MVLITIHERNISERANKDFEFILNCASTPSRGFATLPLIKEKPKKVYVKLCNFIIYR